MRDLTELRAAVVGTGFVGVVHVDALRRLGVEVLGVVGSSPERARAKDASVPLPEPYESFDAMLADERVDVVHLATPNHLHYPQARSALEAGKHVVCEKPLALDSRQSAELHELAERSGRIHCTNFNVRFYPQCQEARALVADGRLGEVWNVHGGYLQDWLLLPTDWNWRLEPEQGGALRAFADIGSHWLDLVQFVTGLTVVELLADLATTIERPDVSTTTDDLAHVLLRFAGGARGSAVISQVSAGRRNSLRFEVDGSGGSLCWETERHEELWLGHRGRPNETLIRDPSLLEPGAAARTALPAGHAEGYADTFKELYRAVYAAVAAGRMPAAPDFPTFADGHRANVLGDCVALSARERRWVQVPVPA